tara:strand:+ start:2348 stop:2692 length:345 start_codon:yes stop_codon:yes gene_type:complete
MKLYEMLFMYLTYTWYILFALASMKLWTFAQLYLDKITYYYNLFVALVLMYHFNPFIKTEITKTHKKMVFSAASFVFISVGLEQLIEDLRRDALKKKPEKKNNTNKTIYDYLNI